MSRHRSRSTGYGEAGDTTNTDSTRPTYTSSFHDHPHTITPPAYTVFVLHGKAGGAQGGNSLNKGEMLARALSADLLIAGHSHHPGVMPSIRYVPNNKGVMCARPMRVMIATSWLDYGGYGADAGMAPVPMHPTTPYWTGGNTRCE